MPDKDEKSTAFEAPADGFGDDLSLLRIAVAGAADVDHRNESVTEYDFAYDYVFLVCFHIPNVESEVRLRSSAACHPICQSVWGVIDVTVRVKEPSVVTAEVGFNTQD